MIGFFGWIISRSSKMRRGVAQVAVILSLVTLMLGALLGTLLQVQFATNVVFLPAGAFGAHPGMLSSGYLVLIGAAILETRLRPSITRFGMVQVILFFLAGLVLGTALLLGIGPLIGLNTLLLLIGAIFFIIRFGARAVQTSWLERSSTCFFVLSGIFILVNVGLNTFLTISIVSGRINPEHIPEQGGGLLLALDHSMCVGVMTNALFGLIREVTGARRLLWPWVDDVLFWGMNIGVAGFLFALVSEMRGLERIFTPIMGVAILLGIIIYVIRLLPKQGSAAAAYKA